MKEKRNYQAPMVHTVVISEQCHLLANTTPSGPSADSVSNPGFGEFDDDQN